MSGPPATILCEPTIRKSAIAHYLTETCGMKCSAVTWSAAKLVGKACGCGHPRAPAMMVNCRPVASLTMSAL